MQKLRYSRAFVLGRSIQRVTIISHVIVEFKVINLIFMFHSSERRGVGGGGGGGNGIKWRLFLRRFHPDFFVKFDLEIAIDQHTRACDRTFEGVPDSGCPPVPAGQPRPFLV